MEFWIDVEDRHGNVLGDGPIRTGLGFSITRKLNEIGAFSFSMPITDRASALLLAEERRIIRCWAIVEGTIREMGSGIVDSRKSKLSQDGILTISGPDLLHELTNRLVKGLVIYSESAVFPVVIFWKRDDDDGTETFQELHEVTDGNFNTGIDIEIAGTNAYLLIGADIPFNFVDFSLVPMAINENSVHWGFSDPRATGWRQPDVSDGTNNFENSGTLEFVRPSNWIKRTIANRTKYWIRADPEKELEVMRLIEILCRYRDIRTDDLTELLAVMPEGWYFDPAWQTATQHGTYHTFSDENCFEALVRLAELHGENFRLGEGRQIQWLGSEITDSGIIAMQAPNSFVIRPANTAYISNLNETINLRDIVSLVQASGSGNASTRVSLSDCLIEPSPPYVLNRYNSSLENTETTAAYGLIERAESFSDISPGDGSGANDVAASTMLYYAAKAWLEERSQPLKSYTLDMVGPLVRVGESIFVDYSLFRNGLVRRLSGDFIVMEAITKIDKSGIHTESLKISNIARKEPNDATLITKLMRQIKNITSHNQPLSANLIR
jgi:hypothetical protein